MIMCYVLAICMKLVILPEASEYNKFITVTLGNEFFSPTLSKHKKILFETFMPNKQFKHCSGTTKFTNY